MKYTLAIAFFIGGLVSLTSCKKEAGDGGTSAITGKVTGKMYSNSNGSEAEKEVTQIIVPNGAFIDDGDYVLLNTPNNGTQYYIWFKWNNGVQPDPGLTGRTAIQVTYTFNESNATVAANVASAVNAIASADFDVAVNNDIIVLTNKNFGQVPDADELSSNILIDVQNQGKEAETAGSTFVEGPIVDERVYIVYGDDTFYSDDVRTDANGHYEFKGLNRGTYKIYALSDDVSTAQGGMIMVETSVEITEKKSVVEATELNIVQK